MFHVNPLPNMKYKVLFSLINNEKVFMNAVCYCRDWCFKDNLYGLNISSNSIPITGPFFSICIGPTRY